MRDVATVVVNTKIFNFPAGILSWLFVSSSAHVKDSLSYPKT